MAKHSVTEGLFEAILRQQCQLFAYLSRMARHSVTEKLSEAILQPVCSITAGMTVEQTICLSVTDGQAFRDGKGV